MDNKELNERFDAMYVDVTKGMDLTKPYMKKMAIMIKKLCKANFINGYNSCCIETSKEIIDKAIK